MDRPYLSVEAPCAGTKKGACTQGWEGRMGWWKKMSERSKTGVGISKGYFLLRFLCERMAKKVSQQILDVYPLEN